MRKIIIVTYQGYFGQGLNLENSLNIDKLKEGLKYQGFSVDEIEIHNLLGDYQLEKEAIYWITSHQNKSVKHYLNDIVFGLFHDFDGEMITSLTNYLSHENKGLQSLLYNKGKNISLVRQQYLDNTPKNLSYPKVIKTIDGAGSRGVGLVNCNDDIKKFLEKKHNFSITIQGFVQNIKFLIKRFTGIKYNKEYELYNKTRGGFVLQEFVKGLEYDIKALVFYDRCYFLKRTIRSNDFRASGSGKFEFIAPPKELIEKVLNIRKSLNSPFASLDMVLDGNEYKCIEYQTTHFGPYTQINAEFYFSIYENSIAKIKKTNDLESDYVYAINEYLRNK
ncbi:hypothetical protein [Vibrio sp. MMH1-50]|uniref:hypothetical protein n=1 Tax=Vibrio sp. MMH1-50 TaxID=2917764 RepID=UPI001EF3BC1B|nr:hypothetical protein [Vibrio sp. MMH1-50]MCG7513133.1 hypothetical protein [Vibrio sp. MMH1-50]